jgi:ribosomal protein L36
MKIFLERRINYIIILYISRKIDINTYQNICKYRQDCKIVRRQGFSYLYAKFNVSLFYINNIIHMENIIFYI